MCIRDRYINDEFFPPEGAKSVQKTAPKKQPNQPKVTVIYEDENLAVLYKPCLLYTSPAHRWSRSAR